MFLHFKFAHYFQTLQGGLARGPGGKERQRVSDREKEAVAGSHRLATKLGRGKSSDCVSVWVCSDERGEGEGGWGCLLEDYIHAGDCTCDFAL
jgi:hypothetical protein